MEKKYKILEVSSVIFKVLSWVSLAVGIVAAVVIFIGGGTPEAPRVTGFIGILLGIVYFFMFLVTSEIVALLLDIKLKVEKGA